ncbi:MAG TPA: acylphosphatase [Sunxiuqinia sp.]|nr:acylphosphatase [Sunxiuqinia sp.]
MKDKKRFHIVVSGRVQGVGFRYFAVQKANDCNLKGWVKNLPDGQVELEAEGDGKDLAAFIDYLKLGNGYSRTDRLSQSEISTLENYPDFNVRY